MRALKGLVETPLDPNVHIRTLAVQTPFFCRRKRGARTAELSEKPEVLGTGEVTQRMWKRYQAYLKKSRPLGRAAFYLRLLERHGCKSIRGLARITGEDHSRIARILKILELPKPVLDVLRTDNSPDVVAFFTERRLRQLQALRNPVRIWERFQQMLKEILERREEKESK